MHREMMSKYKSPVIKVEVNFTFLLRNSISVVSHGNGRELVIDVFSTVSSSWLCSLSGGETCRELIIHRPVWTAGSAHNTTTHTHNHVHYASLLRLCILLAPTHGDSRGEKRLLASRIRRRTCSRTRSWGKNLSEKLWQTNTRRRGVNYLKLT